MLSTMLIPNLESNLSHHVTILKYSACKIVKLLFRKIFPEYERDHQQIVYTFDLLCIYVSLNNEMNSV